MRAVIQNSVGGPDVLVIASQPDPTAKPGEVVVRVKAAGIKVAEEAAAPDAAATPPTMPTPPAAPAAPTPGKRWKWNPKTGKTELQ